MHVRCCRAALYSVRWTGIDLGRVATMLRMSQRCYILLDPSPMSVVVVLLACFEAEMTPSASLPARRQLWIVGEELIMRSGKRSAESLNLYHTICTALRWFTHHQGCESLILCWLSCCMLGGSQVPACHLCTTAPLLFKGAVDDATHVKAIYSLATYLAGRPRPWCALSKANCSRPPPTYTPLIRPQFAGAIYLVEIVYVRVTGLTHSNPLVSQKQ